MPPRKKKKAKLSHSSSSSSSSSSSTSSSADSLDDADIPIVARSSSSRSRAGVSHDPDAVKLCSSFVTMVEQVKQLEEGLYAEDKPGSAVFKVARDRRDGSVEVTRSCETVRGLAAATSEAREGLANEIQKRLQDIAGLEKDAAELTVQIQESEGENAEALGQRLLHVNLLIGKHKARIRQLEQQEKLEVKVEVERVSTRVVVMRQETPSVGSEVRLVASRDESLFVLGGSALSSDEKSVMASVEKYDAKTDRWEVVPASMTCPREGCVDAVLQGQVYAIGGYSDGKNLSSAERFDRKNGKWELVAPMAVARDLAVAGVVGGKVYVAGGSDGKDGLASVECYDPARNSWTDVAPMSCRRYEAAGAVLGGFFYACGGWDGTTEWCTAERYDALKNEWDMIPPMICKRFGCAGAVLAGCVYVLGGFDGASRLSSVERFDPRSNCWEEVAPMTCSRSGLAAAVLDGRLYAIGGGGDDSALSTVERYDTAANRWELVASMTSARLFATSVVTVAMMGRSSLASSPD